jgi:hypothetical protein
LFDPRVWAALALVGAVVGAWWYVSNLHSTIEGLEKWKAQVLFDSEQARKKAEAMKAANDAHTKEVANGYAEAIRSITTEYDSRIKRLLSSAASARPSAVSCSSPGTDARPSDTRSGAAEQATLTEACLKLEQDCVATTTNLLYLQHWLRGVK